jgi:hypothetical protein
LVSVILGKVELENGENVKEKGKKRKDEWKLEVKRSI